MLQCGNVAKYPTSVLTGSTSWTRESQRNPLAVELGRASQGQKVPIPLQAHARLVPGEPPAVRVPTLADLLCLH
eukprot:2312663-Amphidinium_carterae.2